MAGLGYILLLLLAAAGQPLHAVAQRSSESAGLEAHQRKLLAASSGVGRSVLPACSPRSSTITVAAL